MATPALLLTAGAQLLPSILSLFGGGPERLDPEATLRQLIALFQEQLGPAGRGLEAAAASSGARSGAALAQDVASSVGSIGGGAAGATRVTRGLASSASSNRAATGAAQARFQVANAISQLATGALGPTLEGQQGVRPSTGFQNILQGLGGITKAEGNPIVKLLEQILNDSEAGESPFTAEDLSNFFRSPLAGGTPPTFSNPVSSGIPGF